MTAVAAAFGYRYRYSVLICLVFVYSCLLMQSRAALLCMFMLLTILTALKLAGTIRLTGTVIICSGAALVLLVSYVIGFDPIGIVLDGVFLADDSSRGVGSGFVGRDLRWSQGLSIFLLDPIFGAGISVFDTGATPSPHNVVIYSLAQHGATAVLFWAPFIRGVNQMIRRDYRLFLFCFSTIWLFVFNDRFINLNIYPFLLYVIILLYGIEAGSRSVKSASSGLDPNENPRAR